MDRLGVLLAGSGAVLAATWGPLGGFWGRLGASWERLGSLQSRLRELGNVRAGVLGLDAPLGVLLDARSVLKPLLFYNTFCVSALSV